MINNRLWLGTEESAYEYQLLLSSIMEKHGSLNIRLQHGENEDEEPNPVDYEVLDNGIALLTIKGGTISNTTGWSRYFGIVSYEDIRERVAQAADDSSAKMILMDVASSGGAASGVKPLSNFISEVSSKVKPVFTYTSSEVASAALWYGTAGDYFAADEDSMIGSLGVFLVHMSHVDMFKRVGLEPTVFRTSPKKALGNPYEKLTEEASASILKRMMVIHDRFVGAIAKNRELSAQEVSTKIATGEMFEATQALELGLIDKVISFDALIATLGKQLDNQTVAPQPR